MRHVATRDAALAWRVAHLMVLATLVELKSNALPTEAAALDAMPRRHFTGFCLIALFNAMAHASTPNRRETRRT